jgi:hypothetical protein
VVGLDNLNDYYDVILPPQHRLPQDRRYAGTRAYRALKMSVLGLSSKSSIALQSGYNSNLFLASSGVHPAESGAVVANLPAFDLVPRLRFTETNDYLSLLLDY